MPRLATGTIEYRPGNGDEPGKWFGRITLAADESGKKARPWIELGGWPNDDLGRAKAQQAARGAATKARKLRVALGGEPPNATDVQAMGKWFETWIADRQRRGFTSTHENESHYQKHIMPGLGSKHVKDWTSDDMRQLCSALDSKVQEQRLSWKTAVNVWGTATKMCKDACASKIDGLRVRKDNPAAGVIGPDRGVKKAKQYLYPSEFLKFARCSKVPLHWRRAVALSVYLYARAGELETLRWEDVDLEHSTVHIHRSRDRNTGEEKSTKSAEARRIRIEPNMLPLLKVMHEERAGRVYVVDMPAKDTSRGFRTWLRMAKLKRAELHSTTKTRKAMTFHDLRATGLTWLAVRGDDPLKIMQRAGHADFSTTQGYIREAEAVRDGFGEPFPPLPECLLTGDTSESACDQEPSTDPPSGTEPLDGGPRSGPETIRQESSGPTIHHALGRTIAQDDDAPESADSAEIVLQHAVGQGFESRPLRKVTERLLTDPKGSFERALLTSQWGAKSFVFRRRS
jgi:integrase